MDTLAFARFVSDGDDCTGPGQIFVRKTRLTMEVPELITDGENRSG